MREVLRFKNVQDMSNEADEFLTKIVDPEIKACAKFLLISCYSYINDFVQDIASKTYKNLSCLVEFEMMGPENKSSENTKLCNLLQNAPSNSISKKMYNIYNYCEPQMKKYAQMRLMELLLSYYIK